MKNFITVHGNTDWHPTLFEFMSLLDSKYEPNANVQVTIGNETMTMKEWQESTFTKPIIYMLVDDLLKNK